MRNKPATDDDMTFEEIQNILRRKATGFETGGCRSTNQPNESWIGKVLLFRENEDVPAAEKGGLMTPLFQIYLPDLPFVPSALDGTVVLCVFTTLYSADGWVETKSLPEEWEPMGKNWLIREYPSLDGLVVKHFDSSNSFIKPFPLKPILIENDFPQWGDEYIPESVFKEIVRLDDEGFFGEYPHPDNNSYVDRMPHEDGHKIGGWQSFCQSGVDFGDGFEFVFQISSDDKAMLNIVDGGQLNFAKNKNTGEWKMYYDYY